MGAVRPPERRSSELMAKCHKHKHASRGAAEAHIRALQRIGDHTVRRPYLCPELQCGAWHVGREKAKGASCRK